MEIKLNPVGVVQSQIKEPTLKAGSGTLNRDKDAPPSLPDDTLSEILINPEHQDLLDGIEGFSHLLVLYWAHRVSPEARSIAKVHPAGRQQIPRKGIFATCSPARPNPILTIAVKLVERNGRVLRVSGLDAVDGSPVIDIKPYLPHYYSVEDAGLPDWMTRLIAEMAKA